MWSHEARLVPVATEERWRGTLHSLCSSPPHEAIARHVSV